MDTGDVHVQEQKLAELMLLIAERLDAATLAGATKLNKLLFFIDFTHVRKYGVPVTGVEYQRLGRGPAPRRLLPVRSAMVRDGIARVDREEVLGRVQHRLVPLRDPAVEVFTAEERATIDEVLDQFVTASGSTLSDLSHEDPAWLMVDDGDTIPYSAAFLRRGRVTERIRQRARKIEAELVR